MFAEIVDCSDIMENIRKEKVLRRWEEFPEEDPFQYSLQKIFLDKDNNIVNEKCFIGRKNNVKDYFKNVSHSYTKKELTDIFVKNGFCVSIYPYSHNGSLLTDVIAGNNIFRILAKKI